MASTKLRSLMYEHQFYSCKKSILRFERITFHFTYLVINNSVNRRRYFVNNYERMNFLRFRLFKFSFEFERIFEKFSPILILFIYRTIIKFIKLILYLIFLNKILTNKYSIRNILQKRKY